MRWRRWWRSVDVWDGPEGQPTIYHGHTLTGELLVRDVLTDVIKPYAFKATPYPLILSIENHLGREQQAILASLLVEILGGISFLLSLSLFLSLEFRSSYDAILDGLERLCDDDIVLFIVIHAPRFQICCALWMFPKWKNCRLPNNYGTRSSLKPRNLSVPTIRPHRQLMERTRNRLLCYPKKHRNQQSSGMETTTNRSRKRTLLYPPTTETIRSILGQVFPAGHNICLRTYLLPIDGRTGSQVFVRHGQHMWGRKVR